METDHVADGYCDDIANTDICYWDGGDCCGPNRVIDYCTECQCHETTTTTTTTTTKVTLTPEPTTTAAPTTTGSPTTTGYTSGASTATCKSFSEALILALKFIYSDRATKGSDHLGPS